ncbi:MAG: choice-of-anchor L domain-containing protein, partial [Flavobacterium sp.]
MKIKFLFILISFSLFTLGQGVTINQTLTPQQLVQQVLLNNSPCATATSITTMGNCGIGRFNGTGTSFPFADGVVIRSGTVGATAGIFQDDDLSMECPGNNVDTQLQTISNNNSGTTTDVSDVSSITFNFVPATNLFSFNFIFASNEYGVFQCTFGDVFAFILTDVTAGTPFQNIALVPGTSTPISVTSIRNNAHNAGCNSVNPQFFNVFSQVGNANSPINMRGYTQVMNASATVIPGHQYTIKLVIGDFQDKLFDSAVFIESGSFNIGSPIISDYSTFITFTNWTIANGAALCPNTCRLAKAGASPISGATYQWFKNNVLIPGATNFDFNICEPGTYKVVVTLGACVLEDTILVETFPSIV